MATNAARVMIIDDSETVLKVTAHKLKIAGFDVITAGNERSLLEIAQHKPDLVLLDVSMPGLTGDRIAQLLKDTGLLKRGLVVFFSSRTAAELEDLVIQTGAAGYIRKDLATGDFVSQVQYWVGEVRRQFPS